MTGTRKHYNDGFEGPPLEAGITWWPGEGKVIEASGEDCLQASSRSDESAVPATRDAPNPPVTLPIHGEMREALRPAIWGAVNDGLSVDEALDTAIAALRNSNTGSSS